MIKKWTARSRWRVAALCAATVTTACGAGPCGQDRCTSNSSLLAMGADQPDRRDLNAWYGGLGMTTAGAAMLTAGVSALVLSSHNRDLAGSPDQQQVRSTLLDNAGTQETVGAVATSIALPLLVAGIMLWASSGSKSTEADDSGEGAAPDPAPKPAGTVRQSDDRGLAAPRVGAGMQLAGFAGAGAYGERALGVLAVNGKSVQWTVGLGAAQKHDDASYGMTLGSDVALHPWTTPVRPRIGAEFTNFSHPTKKGAWSPFWLVNGSIGLDWVFGQFRHGATAIGASFLVGARVSDLAVAQGAKAENTTILNVFYGGTLNLEVLLW